VQWNQHVVETHGTWLAEPVRSHIKQLTYEPSRGIERPTRQTAHEVGLQPRGEAGEWEMTTGTANGSEGLGTACVRVSCTNVVQHPAGDAATTCCRVRWAKFAQG
jgi:hypothetical protein